MLAEQQHAIGDVETISSLASVNARTREVYEAAAELIVHKGFVGASIADLAKAVGMTKAGLYHHIASKQDMLFCIMQHALDELERVVVAPVSEIVDPEDRLRRIIELHLRGILSHGQAFTVVFSEVHHLDSEKRSIVAGRIQAYRNLVSTTLCELRKQGKLRDLDVDVATRHLLQTIVGFARWYDGNQNPDLVIRETVNFNLAALLRKQC